MPPDPDERGNRLAAEAVARRSFGTAFRGFDQLEVRGFLSEVAEEMRVLRDREADLRTRLAAAEQRATRAEEFDEARITQFVGEETARVLQAAKDAAASIRARAEESVARMLREAQDDITRMRSEADGEVKQRLDAAERAAEEMRASAQTIRAEAVDAAAAEVEAAREEGRSMVAEAQAVRERVLQDLSRKRKAVRGQIDQLRAGRERLLEAYDLVQRTLDEATHELRVALPEARLAAESAGRRLDEAHDDDEVIDLVAATEVAGGSLTTSEPEEVTAPPPPAPEESSASPAAAAERDAPEPEPGARPAVEQAAAAAALVAEVLSLEPEVVRPPRRRRRRRSADLPEGELHALRAPDPVEGVRVVPTEEIGAGAGSSNGSEEAVEVDDLFARLRAERAAEVARAMEAMAELGETDAEAEPGAELAAEPASDSEGSETAAEDEAPEPLGEAEAEAPAAAAADAAASERETVLERRDAAAEDVEHRLARHLKRVLADEQNEVLDTVRRGRFSSVADLLPAEGGARYADAARADLEDAARVGAGFFAADGDDGVPAHLAVDVGDLAGGLAHAIVSVVHDRVERAVSESGGDNDELTERVRACYREWKTQRISDAARHYVLAAFTRGVFEAQPEGARLCWLVDDGGSPCPDAEDNALAGPVVKGKPFPTGHPYPPAHPGCRCLVVPAPPDPPQRTTLKPDPQELGGEASQS